MRLGRGVERPPEIGRLEIVAGLPGRRDRTRVDEADVGRMDQRADAVARAVGAIVKLANMHRAGEVELPAADLGHEHRAPIERNRIVLALVELLHVIGEHAALQQHGPAGVFGARAKPALIAERGVDRRALDEAGKQVAGRFLEAPERLVLADREGERLRRLVAEIEIDEVGPAFGKVDFGAIGEAAGNLAFDADVRAAHFVVVAETVIVDAFGAAHGGRIELEPPARLDGPSAVGGELGRAVLHD